MKFNNERGTLLIHIDIEGIDFSHSKIEFNGKIFEPKDELHITIVGNTTGQLLRKLIDREPRTEELLDVAIRKEAWSYKIKNEMYHVQEDKKVKNHDGNITTLHSESIIVMAEVSGIESFYRKLSTLIGKKVDSPPTHVTLYTYGDPRGIGLANEKEFKRFVRRKIFKGDLKEIS